jgi:hypothetical protein
MDWKLENVQHMGFLDWLALCLTAGVIGTCIANELRDITLCHHSRRLMAATAKVRHGAVDRASLWTECRCGGSVVISVAVERASLWTERRRGESVAAECVECIVVEYA